MDRIDLKDLYIEEIEKILYDIRQESYRARQIFKWIYRGVCSFSEMTDISKELRQELENRCVISCLEIRDVQQSGDGTSKYLFGLRDQNSIESVLMKYKYGYSACVSTQVGCRMGCRFCASSKCSFVRNLTAGEIVDQVITIQRETGERVSKVVFMGIGEPLENYENTVKAVKLLNSFLGLNIGYRNMSVSTCGLVPAILKLADEKLPITLSVSLHAPNDSIRSEIMPVNKKYNIKELLDACEKYYRATKRRISFEYVLIAGINDSDADARELAARLRGMLAHVNLIQLNTVQEGNYKRSSAERVSRFKNILEQKGIETTQRRELGTEIEAACGQLRRKSIED